MAQTAPADPPPATAAKPAQPAKPAPAPASAGPAATINVKAERPVNRIDREVYDQKNDPENATSSAADALQKVPSVTVDADGTVALRGNRNVQIMVDGKPSAMLSGDNRGDALRSIPAENLDSIEVINNPGAQFGTDSGGGGPILNLVMRRERRPGGYGLATANAGTRGRRNAFTSGSYNSGRWGFEGTAALMHSAFRTESSDTRESMNPVTGTSFRSGYDGASSGASHSARLSGTLHYNLGDKEALEAQLTLTPRSTSSQGDTRYRRFGAGDALADDYDRRTTSASDSHSWDWRANYERKGTPEEGTLKLMVQGSGDLSDVDRDYRNDVVFTSVGTPDAHNRQHVGNDRRNLSTDGDYERSNAGSIVRLGYRLARSENTIDNRYVDVAPTGIETVNATRTNLFELTETVAALYGEYQQRLGERWGVKGGLRAEYTDTDVRQYTSDIHAKNHYFNAIPSAFATYKLSEDSQIRLAWSHRVSRPTAGALNPFVVYVDEFNLSSGNPYLKPSQSDSIELGLESKVGGMTTNLRGYLRRSSDIFVQRRVFVSPSVLLATTENDGTNRSGGIEVVVDGKVTPTFSVSANTNLGVYEQNILDPLRPDAKRTTTALSGHVRFSWTIRPTDTLTSNVNMRGRTLLGQGYTEPVAMLNASWRHLFTPRLTGTLSAFDILNRQRTETVIDTSVLHEHTLFRPNARTLSFSLSYRFGGPDGKPPGERGPGMHGEGHREGGPGGAFGPRPQ
ncbi:MAG: TonB-dependent receptor domain-containing protein [Telluria sp.]